MTQSSRTLGQQGNKSQGVKASAGLVTHTRLRELRTSRGLGVSEVAKHVCVSRQTIHAIESGDYVPNTAVALQLSRLLEVPVEDIFSIRESNKDTADEVVAQLLAAPTEVHSKGNLVSLARVGSRTIAIPHSYFPVYLGNPDGAIVSRTSLRTTIRRSSKADVDRNTLVIAGCDPALSLLAAEIESGGTRVVTVPSSSREALAWLEKGLVHVAGSHLRDSVTGDYNVPIVQKIFGKGKVRVITFAEWEQGLLTRRGNQQKISSLADLTGSSQTIVNRERGSGARDLLDRQLREIGASRAQVKGYDHIAPSHLAAALVVANGGADCCVANVSAARWLGLDFVPLSKERFDLVISISQIEKPNVRALFNALDRLMLRRKLSAFAGYDVHRTGTILM